MSTGHEAHAPTAGEYIVHHLTHFNSTGHAQSAVIDWSVWNLDTLFFSVGLGIVTLLILYKAASKATSGVPGRLHVVSLAVDPGAGFRGSGLALAQRIADQFGRDVHNLDHPVVGHASRTDHAKSAHHDPVHFIGCAHDR